MDGRFCIVHYEGHRHYEAIKDISQVNEQRIRLAKKERETVGGANYHITQCQLIPEVIDNERHGIHLEPCYKLFTFILSKRKELKPTETRQSARLSSTLSESKNKWTYPKECYICKKYKIKYKREMKYPKTISDNRAAFTIKAAAKENDPDMYYEIKDVDLYSSEFKYHQEPCYKKFCKGYYASDRERELEANTVTESNESNDLGILEEAEPCTSSYASGNYDAVKNLIKENVIKGNQAISITALHEVYGLETEGEYKSKYRADLKTRIISDFRDDIIFLSLRPNKPEIVISSSSHNSYASVPDKISCIEKAAQYLRDDIVEYCNSLPDLQWPPTIEELTSEKRLPPASVTLFLTTLLKSTKHSTVRSKNITRLIDSYSADMIHGVTRGEVLTAKHFLIALGLHNMTGQKKVVEVVSKLGHCISYTRTCEIETALAQKAQLLATQTSALPLKPSTSRDSVLTFLGVDNFDLNIDRQCGGGAINITNLVAFQEISDGSSVVDDNVNIQRTKSRYVQDKSKDVTSFSQVNNKKEPPKIKKSDETFHFDDSHFIAGYLTWLFMRNQNCFDQVVPSYFGWKLQLREKQLGGGKPVKTVETYLPPINSKVTEFKTIAQYMSYLQSLAQEMNMPYVNITMDIGAAINAYKFIWNHPNQFGNVVIHPGDFHLMKENFKVIGLLLSHSGFEDSVFQAGICTSGSLVGVLAGSHYNRAWTVHSVFAEALERLLMKRFLYESKIEVPSELLDFASDPSSFTLEMIPSSSAFTDAFTNFKDKTRQGELGMTAKFWLIYLDLMRVQVMAHNAVQENDFSMTIHVWSLIIPFYFATNMTNYARYGTYYTELMKNIDQQYPGLKQFLEPKGLSVQSQDRYPLKTAIDQRGEQTINRDGKTAGGIKRFAGDKSGVLKWCLNRSEQVKNTRALKQMAGIGDTFDTYKALRPSQVLKSETMVDKAIKVFTQDYLNPFDYNLDKTSLFNLSSGMAIPVDIANELLDIPQRGAKLATAFRDNRIDSTLELFHSPIKRNKIRTFTSALEKTKISKSNTTKTVELNRNIIGTLLSFSAKYEKPIDFDHALKYPLSHIPLSLAHPDGSHRTTSKSKLYDAILDEESPAVLNPQTGISNSQGNSAFVIDLIASLRTMTQIPETYEGIADRFVKSLPIGYNRVDIVADTYREISIKNSERKGRGHSSKVIIKSLQTKVQPDFCKFMKNGDNKSRLIDLIFEYITSNKLKVINYLRTTKIMLSSDNKCICVTRSCVNVEEDLCSNQEEADTKVILHCLHILHQNSNVSVILRSPSADTDIFILTLALLHDHRGNVFIDSGSGTNRKVIDISNVELENTMRKALIGLHAFTGNDFVSSFFRKGKEKCWKLIEKYHKFQVAFQELGERWELSEELLDNMEEFVCNLYGYRSKNINEVRHRLFMKKYINSHKVIDLATLPPCHSVLRLHAKRANFVACIWKRSNEVQVEMPDIFVNGWTLDGDIVWVDEIFPEDIAEILLDPRYDEDDIELGSDCETDDEEDGQF